MPEPTVRMNSNAKDDVACFVSITRLGGRLIDTDGSGLMTATACLGDGSPIGVITALTQQAGLSRDMSSGLRRVWPCGSGSAQRRLRVLYRDYNGFHYTQKTLTNTISILPRGSPITDTCNP